jgi:hypothetical protein
MIRALSVVLRAFALAFAAPVAAQAPEGIMMRVDQSTNPQDPDDVPDVTVTAVEDGLQVSTGPAVMLWQEDQRASGNYTLSGRFTLLEPSSHRNFYGLVFGGRNLTSENQRYLYFLIAQTGEFIVVNRIDNANTNSLVSRTEHSAIERPNANGRSVNDLAVRINGDRIEFVVNGTVVHATERSGSLLDSNGLYGVRINHVLPGVLVENLSVTGM